MRGHSIRLLLAGKQPSVWMDVAYHRYWMHKDPDHNAYAHYGIRKKRYKLIYWFSDGLGLPGTGDEKDEPEWKLLDCLEDPLELFNVYSDPAEATIVQQTTEQPDNKIKQIGDIPEHQIKMVFV